MMYGGFDVFKIYLAVKNHFTSDSYDYARYGGKTNASLDSFTKRKDRYFFHKLSKKYNREDILDFFVANFSDDSKKWIGNLTKNDGREIYLEYRKRKESFDYFFRNDCVLVSNDFNAKRFSFNDGLGVFGGQHPRLLQLLLQRKIGIQTCLVLDNFVSYSKNWDKEIVEKVVWPYWSKKMKKMKTFINYNETKCKLILKEVFVNGE